METYAMRHRDLFAFWNNANQVLTLFGTTASWKRSEISGCRSRQCAGPLTIVKPSLVRSSHAHVTYGIYFEG